MHILGIILIGLFGVAIYLKGFLFTFNNAYVSPNLVSINRNNDTINSKPTKLFIMVVDALRLDYLKHMKDTSHDELYLNCFRNLQNLLIKNNSQTAIFGFKVTNIHILLSIYIIIGFIYYL